MVVLCLYIIFYYFILLVVFILGFFIEFFNIIICFIWIFVFCRCRGFVGIVVFTRVGVMSGVEIIFLKIKYIIFIYSIFVLLLVVFIFLSVFNCDYIID